MTTLWIVVAATLAVTPAEGSNNTPAPVAKAAPGEQPHVTPHQFRAAVSDALRREATTRGKQHDLALRQLIAIYQQLEADNQLPDAERRKRLGQIRLRLARAAKRLEKKVARSADDRADAKGAPKSVLAVLAQRLPANAGPRGANPAGRQPGAGRLAGPIATQQAGTVPGEADQAEQLIDLIRTTIAPDTWDVRGGPGSIVYFAPKKVLVIRQTSEVHGQFRNLFRQLRGN